MAGLTDTRRGQLISLTDAVTYALIVGIIVEGFIYTQIVVNQADTSSERLYTENTVGDDILSAPCATESRAVFYRSAVKSGDLACIDPPAETFVQFDIGDTNYTWSISRADGGGTAVSAAVHFSYDQRYDVLVYDETSGQTEQAILAVG